MISIRQPLSFSEIGKKDNQEDYLFPSEADKNTRVFVLCDGMGGHEKGEVASKTVAETLGSYLTSFVDVEVPEFEDALMTAYDELDKIEAEGSKKPGTTMTCLCLNNETYLVAHIGDSRIYHIRPSLYDAETGKGGILYRSYDHSLVNDLLKVGEITEEEAASFPHKNIITRAMQPNLDRRYKADVYEKDDLKEGDYFFLCCDGVLEKLSDTKLCEILAEEGLTDEDKLHKIKAICDEGTRDNYTCWLIPIDKVKINRKQEENNSVTQTDDSSLSAADDEATAQEAANNQLLSQLKGHAATIGNKVFHPLSIIVCGAIIALCIFLWLLFKLFTPIPT